MLTYQYEARNTATGKKIRATVQADNEQVAAKLLRERGLSPLSIKVDRKSSGTGRLFKRVNAKDKVMFSRQLATLLNAGLPLMQSLRSVAQQTTSRPLRLVENQIISDVEAGQPFSVALAKHPKVFNQIFISLVQAGETSGTLDTGLERLADQQEKDADIMSKVRGAMIYPAVVLLVMVAVVGFMIVEVLPQVQSIYAGIPGVSLPILTRILLGVSHFVINFWWIVLILIVGFIVFMNRWSKTKTGREVIDYVKMKAWPFGPLFMKMYMARFTRTATTLVASGVPLLHVLEITADSVDNVHIAKSLQKASEKIKGGKSLSDSISNDPNFLELVPNMIRIGEQSGSLETMLDKAANYYEKDVDNEIKTISTLIEPVLMIIMGAVAIMIVAAVLMPIYGLVNQPGFLNNIG